MPDEKFGGGEIGRAALAVAIAELNAGAQEIGGNNCGPWVKKYLNGLAEEVSSWCAGFVSYCYFNSGFAMPFNYTVSARDLCNQFKANNWAFILNDSITPEPGDFVFWWRNHPQSWKGHVGLVHHSANGFLYTIEGNRTPKVEGFSHRLCQLTSLLAFGRVPNQH
ncbi:MAG TPA: CHAP domain-containing protein [candidate division Zixibacteria bacterium]|nr:CHAP domain-containing protein [candidate division Zixibacteria bacterium]